MIDYAGLMTKSSLLRKQLGEDESSPVDIMGMAQRIDGLTLVYYPLGDRLSGMCVKSKRGNKLIAVNSEMTLGRQRFSLAHEFYHLFYDTLLLRFQLFLFHRIHSYPNANNRDCFAV